MDEQHSPLELLFNKAENYFKTSIELYKFKIISTSTKMIASLISCFVFCIFSLLGILLISVAFAFWLGKYYNNLSVGFLIVGFFYIVVSIFFTLSKNSWIEKWLRKKMITILLKSTSIE